MAVGPQARSFKSCVGGGELWLLDNSPALPNIVAAYRAVLPAARPYAPLFMVVVGRLDERPLEGFGAKYAGGFLTTHYLHNWLRGNCRSGQIVVDLPSPGNSISSPLLIRGRARGTWFFEGDFPLLLKDGSGGVVSTGYASAQGEWMTTDFVPFAGRLEFDPPHSGRGTLILQKDNPSDLPQYDAVTEIPVFFE